LEQTEQTRGSCTYAEHAGDLADCSICDSNNLHQQGMGHDHKGKQTSSKQDFAQIKSKDNL
jgi:hypothetical protein